VERLSHQLGGVWDGLLEEPIMRGRAEGDSLPGPRPSPSSLALWVWPLKKRGKNASH
jgi:hypothetical protein